MVSLDQREERGGREFVASFTVPRMCASFRRSETGHVTMLTRAVDLTASDLMHVTTVSYKRRRKTVTCLLRYMTNSVYLQQNGGKLIN